jgi:nucleoside-diphosphate-sugar epimerase
MLIPGDGTNLWSLCHSSDFADAFCELIGNEKAIGEDFHITGEEWLNWIDIGKEILSALGVPKAKLVHIPIKSILNLQIPKTSNLSITYLGENFRGQRMWCDIYDNSKIKKIAPGWRCQIKFYDGIRMTFEWLMADPGRMRFNKDLDLILERLTVENMNNIY